VWRRRSSPFPPVEQRWRISPAPPTPTREAEVSTPCLLARASSCRVSVHPPLRWRRAPRQRRSSPAPAAPPPALHPCVCWCGAVRGAGFAPRWCPGGRSVLLFLLAGGRRRVELERRSRLSSRLRRHCASSASPRRCPEAGELQREGVGRRQLLSSGGSTAAAR
jgi:hypothetical protein